MNHWLLLLVRVVVIAVAAAALSFATLPGGYLFHLQITLVYVASSVLVGRLLGWNRPDFGLWRVLLVCVLAALVGGAFLSWQLARHGTEVSLPMLVVASLIGCAFCLFFHARDSQVRLWAQLAEQARLTAEQQRLLAESQLRALQSQIEPHFLFNTLANLGALITSDSQRATALLELLTRLLRTSLVASRDPLRPLADELTLVETYLAIQQIRLGDRLRYRLQCQPDVDPATPFPPLLLQPLVENALSHGIEALPAGGEVSVSVSRRDGQLLLSVEDSGGGFGHGDSGHGLGLSNVRQRLAALFGERGRLTLSERPAGGVRAQLEVPCAA